VLCALALLSNLADIIPSSKVIPRAFRLDVIFRQEGLTKDFEKSQERGFNGVHFSLVPPNKLASFDHDEYMLLYANSVQELGQEQLMVLEELNGQQCIMSDLMVRNLHNFDPASGGAPVPHILLDRVNDVWRVNAMISFQQHGSLGMGMTGGLNSVKKMDHSVSVATCILSHRMTVGDRDFLASE
jgi:hypothetical protein